MHLHMGSVETMSSANLSSCKDVNEILADTASADGLLLRQQPQTLIA